ncbi:hypothetical protein CHUAL_013486 [Chamberlinius hualienensis]
MIVEPFIDDNILEKNVPEVENDASIQLNFKENHPVDIASNNIPPADDSPVSPTFKRGPGRPSFQFTGKRGRPKKIYKQVPDLCDASSLEDAPASGIITLTALTVELEYSCFILEEF